jgi:hypothetical protein
VINFPTVLYKESIEPSSMQHKQLIYQKMLHFVNEVTGISKTTLSGMSVGMILLLVVASIFMVVGAYLVGQFQLALNTSGLPANSIAAQESIYTNAYNALILGSIGLIVIAAVGILQILTGGFGRQATTV